MGDLEWLLLVGYLIVDLAFSPKQAILLDAGNMKTEVFVNKNNLFPIFADFFMPLGFGLMIWIVEFGIREP